MPTKLKAIEITGGRIERRILERFAPYCDRCGQFVCMRSSDSSTTHEEPEWTTEYIFALDTLASHVQAHTE